MLPIDLKSQGMTKSDSTQASSDQLVGAVYRQDEKRVIEILNTGTSVDSTVDGLTPLMHAVLTVPPSPEFVRFLLNERADPNIQEKGQGWSALHFAARDGLTAILQALLRYGAVVDLQDVFGNTPLLRATFQSYKNHNCLDVIRVLLAAGADPDKENRSGVSARISARDPGWEAASELFSDVGRPRKST